MRAVVSLWAVASLVWLGACGASKGSDNSTDTGVVAASETDAGGTVDSASSATEPTPIPVWWSLEGSLTIAAAAPDLTLSYLTIGLVDEALTPICVTGRLLASATALDVTEEEVHGLWAVELQEGDGCTDALATVPPSFDLGLGAYDPQLNQALDPTGLDGASLFGLYLSEEPSLFVFGVAYTPEQEAGTTLPSPPVPDGTYTVRGLYLLPL